MDGPWPPDRRVIICYTKCWACNFNDCPGGPHTWMDSDDIDHDADIQTPQSPEDWAQLAADKPCGCSCVTDSVYHCTRCGEVIED